MQSAISEFNSASLITIAAFLAHRMTVETTLAISFFRANATKKSEEETHFCEQNLRSLLPTVQNFLY